MELDDRIVCITHRSIILHVQILHCLHQLTLNISGIRRLDGRINQTLTPGHSVEEELCRLQTGNEAALNESSRLCAVIISRKVGKRAILQSILNSATCNKLLAKKTHHLCDVDIRTFGSRNYHLVHTVLGGKTFHNLLDQLRR